MSALSRRNLLRTLSLFAAAALPAVVETPADELTAIPSDAVDKIKAWQAAHRKNVRATDAYSASTRFRPIDKAECDRCFYAMVASEKPVEPARAAMIMALLRV